MTRYTFDTNIIVNLKNWYPRDLFGGLWDRIEDAAARQEACICNAIHGELSRGGDDLADWAKNLPGFVCPVTQPEVDEAQRISNDHPEWVQQTLNAGDPWIIAHALGEGSDIVTEEKGAGPGVLDKNQKVPNVAAENSVNSMKFFEYLRRQGWTFQY